MKTHVKYYIMLYHGYNLNGYNLTVTNFYLGKKCHANINLTKTSYHV